MKWKSKKGKRGRETYEINFDGRNIYIDKDPKKDTVYFCSISSDFESQRFWGDNEADIKAKLSRRKIPKEIVDEFKIIP